MDVLLNDDTIEGDIFIEPRYLILDTDEDSGEENVYILQKCKI